uniref:Ion transport domain-containing protein n=1 Tax=Hemiselmis andersenii TaxID=464988 RepID=A0A6T8NHJ3_HEMAN|mmetsp:Transcript_3019/g.6903  ORF Transcript_3019/g.6903 Transcript_3019/m.6903 type:complete len:1162 (+) Transcript_3019:201-3686(+)
MKGGTAGKVHPDSGQDRDLGESSTVESAAPAYKRTVLHPLPPLANARLQPGVPTLSPHAPRTNISGQHSNPPEQLPVVAGTEVGRGDHGAAGHTKHFDQQEDGGEVGLQAPEEEDRDKVRSLRNDEEESRMVKEEEGKSEKDGVAPEEKAVHPYAYQVDQTRYDELRKKLSKWERNTQLKYKAEKQDKARMESDEDYFKAIAGWMREVGGVAQTEHPIWVKIQEYALDENVKQLSDSDVINHTATGQLLADLHDHYTLGNGKDVKGRKDKQADTLHRFYNCCGDIGLHMVFLNAYIFSSEKDGQRCPHQQLISVGKYLIENDMVWIDQPYESDLQVWKSLIRSIQDHNNKVSKRPSAKDLMTVKLPQHMNDFIGEYNVRRTKISAKGHGFSGLYTGETVLHMAIVFGDEKTVQWLLEKGASLKEDAKATGAFFMPRVIRRGHLDEEKTPWREWKTVNNVQSDDDVVGNFNPLSAHSDRDLYFGQYPLSFAVSQGRDSVCQIIHDHSSNKDGVFSQNRDSSEIPEQLNKEPTEWDSLVNMVDDLGNTPLHIAVMHGKQSTCDWLLENGAKSSLRIMNKQGLTPFTLSVWLGDVEMYTHFANGPLCTLLWKYGQSELKLTDLEQIDTFRTRSVLRHTSDNEDELKKAHIHAHPSWRSAMEIIIEKELKEFTNERIFDYLVMSKWDSFGRVIYFFRVFALYIAILTFFFAASMIRINTLKELDRKPKTGWDAFSEDDSGIMWVMLSSIGVVLLGNIAWILLRVKRRDLDKDHDGSISTEEAMMFLFKNLGSLCGFVACILFILVTVCRSQGWDEEEHALIACTSIVMFCNVLPIVTAFKYVGVLVLTTYRMLISDVARFIVVYIVMLLGFSTAMYVLFDTSDEAQVLDSTGLKLTDFGSVMRKMLYISLGEVGSLDREMDTPLQLVIYFVWVVLTNVLLLNLLISMMGQTFSDIQGDTHNAWVFPVANFILRCESHIQSRRWRTFTRSGKRGSNVKDESTSDRQRSAPDGDQEDENEQLDEVRKPYNPHYLLPWPWGMSERTFRLCQKIKREHRFTELRAGIIEEDKKNSINGRLDLIQNALANLAENQNSKVGPEAVDQDKQKDDVQGRSNPDQRHVPQENSVASSRSGTPELRKQLTRQLTSKKIAEPMNNNQIRSSSRLGT